MANLETFTLEAGADLSGAQYGIVRQSAANVCKIGSLGTDSALVGVLQNAPQSGEFATIADGGISKVIAGAAITQAALITVNSSARAIAAGSGDMVVGRALEAAGADGDIITARLRQPVRWAGAI